MIDPYLIDSLQNTNSEQSWNDETQIPTTYVSTFDTFDLGYYGKDPLSKSAQYKCPPVPTIQLIEPYFREDGTLVKAHFRTEADSFTENNLKP